MPTVFLNTGKRNMPKGAFYVWTKNEIEDSLGGDAEIFDFHYGVSAKEMRRRAAIRKASFAARIS